MSRSKEHEKAAAKRAAAAQDPTELRAALEAERQGYQARGLTDRAKQVTAQINGLGKAAGDNGGGGPGGDGGEQTTSARRGRGAIDKPTTGAQAPTTPAGPTGTGPEDKDTQPEGS
ncbi:hypothetical protein [Cellulomonas uda]|uniref:Uncharacterized protein n=1 Tax=Cellulomonas uda TaxID=1714 RepID=A0A4Y3K614_CELUD|nr:hypothetical protein [Cellulomonas uda]NII67814.1 hypothetical protein [Cellulomonas uda]GEA79939.1 hypothetical protein CUD01_03830 [Cellulomonas uda]